MNRFVLILYTLILVLLGGTTLVESRYGTDFVASHVYHTVWFCVLWGILAIALLWSMVKVRLHRRLPVAMLHLSFLVILAGAGTSFITSQKGYVHLVEGEEVRAFVDNDHPTVMHALPFSLSLDSFSIRTYPGTEAPMDFISCVKLKSANGKTENLRISMNRIGTYQGYRLYQSSFDEGNRGSWISVNYDPWGTGLSYAGYLMMGLSMIGLLFARKEEFIRLLRHPLLRKSALLAGLFWMTAADASAGSHVLPAFNRAKADSLASRQVIYNDRVAPFNTLARDFVVKLTGSASYGGLTPEQVVSGWLLRPDAWQHEPMILVKNGELRQRLGIEGKYARLTDFFDGGRYLLESWWKGIGQPQQAQTSFQKAVEEADEKVGLILMLQNGSLIRPLPKDGSVQPLPETKVQAELLYNRIPLAKMLFMFDLFMGLAAFALLILDGMQGQELHHPCRTKTLRAIGLGRILCRISLWISLLLVASLYGLRWYVAGRVPLANGYETMLFLALCTTAVALVLHRRFPVMLPFGLLLTGFALLVSHLGQMNPQVTPLVPVLLSPWLSLHVSTVMLSYALLAFIFLNAIVAFCLPRHAEMLMLLSRLLLYPAVFLLGIGIFLGAVWANQSWGSYWSWDSKETWALITFMIYGVAFHSQSIGWLRSPKHFHTYTLLAFLTVLMTYVGVNYFLTGMHSYA